MRSRLLTLLLGAALLGPGQSPPLVDRQTESELAAYLRDICDWIMTLDVGSGYLKNTKDTEWSIFINGNFARVLMAGHRVTGSQAYLEEALRWCDTFCQQQRLAITSTSEEGGYWPFDGKERDIYFGDTGTATTALALGYRFATAARKPVYLKALERYACFVRTGCINDPQGKGRGGSPGWVIREGEHRGALGCGYYQGHVSRDPYTISTGTTGGAFFSEFYAISRRPEAREVAADAVRWLLKIRKPDGEIPYILDGKFPYQETWPLDTMTYCAEAFVAACTLLDDAALRSEVAREIRPSVEWLLRTQNADGSWGAPRSPDQQRSPGAVTLLAWYYRHANADARVAGAVRRYVKFLLDPGHSRAYGVKELVRTTGFVGLAAAEVLKPEVTFTGGAPRD